MFFMARRTGPVRKVSGLAVLCVAVAVLAAGCNANRRVDMKGPAEFAPAPSAEKVDPKSVAFYYTAPTFAAGTRYQLISRAMTGKIEQYEIEYLGEGATPESQYDFNGFILSRDHALRPAKAPYFTFVPVSFPLWPGKTWDYGRSIKLRLNSETCGDVAEMAMTAVVADKLETYELDGKRLDVVAVDINGILTAECNDTKINTRVLYSPELGFVARMDSKNLNAKGEVFRESWRKVVGYSLPNKKPGS